MTRNNLSQEEIDSLIAALGSGVIEEQESKNIAGEHRLYDFRRPSKLSKEQMRTLRVIHENFARVLGNFLSTYLRVPAKVQLLSVSQVTYEEFVFSLQVPTLVTIFNMSQELGSALLETNPSIVFPIIDIVFGGGGTMPPQTRELTDIEITVMRQINTKFLNNLCYAWGDIARLSPTVETMDTNQQYNQMFASTETVILLTFNVQIKDNTGLINLCLPYISIEKIAPRLNAQVWFKQANLDAPHSREKVIIKQLEKVDLKVTALLGKTTVSLDDFLQFREGDVIQLYTREADELDIYVEKELLFKGHAGLCGHNAAVQITRWAEEEGQ
ncbi:MAG TPA: flagellar motor switch protein FliM [Firmicutes bacterium]|nr:flagellar motor switch protein FliM [Bacillota bacterium]